MSSFIGITNTTTLTVSQLKENIIDTISSTFRSIQEISSRIEFYITVLAILLVNELNIEVKTYYTVNKVNDSEHRIVPCDKLVAKFNDVFGIADCCMLTRNMVFQLRVSFYKYNTIVFNIMYIEYIDSNIYYIK